MDKLTSIIDGNSSLLSQTQALITDKEYVKLARKCARIYSPFLTYERGDFVIYDYNIYECLEDITIPEAFVFAKWKFLGQY